MRLVMPRLEVILDAAPSLNSEIGQMPAAYAVFLLFLIRGEFNFAEAWILSHRRPRRYCHSDRRDGDLCRPGVEESLLDFGFEAREAFRWRRSTRNEPFRYAPGAVRQKEGGVSLRDARHG